jgi:hypothetical protein
MLFVPYRHLPPFMSLHSRPRRLFLPLLMVGWLLASSLPAIAQETSDRQIVAPVQSPAAEGPLALTSFWVDAESSRVVIELASPLIVPESGNYRLSVLMGDPSAGRVRLSLQSTAGSIEGRAEEGDGEDWSSLEPVGVGVEGSQVFIEIPSDYVGDDAQIWVEAGLDVDGEQSGYTSPVFPWADMVEPSGQTMHTASMAWSVAGEQPPPGAVEISSVLALTADDEVLQITYDAPVPTEIGGIEVVNAVDVVRVAEQVDGRAATPFLIAIDHGESSVALLDGTAALPAEIPSDGEWIRRGVPSSGIAAGDAVEIGIAGLLGVVDVEADRVGFGVARSMTLVDGTVVRADGAVASLVWLQTEPRPDEPATPATTAVPADEADSSGSSDSGIPVGLIMIVVVVVGISVAFWFFMRDRERRHEEASSGPMLRPSQPVTPGSDRSELEDLTEEIFGE